MATKRIATFVTGNPHKLEEFNAILSGTLEVNHKKLDLDEYQGNPDDITTKKCLEAARILDSPVFIEDVSLEFNALGGMPGPYIKWFLEKIGPSGLHKMLAGFNDYAAQAVCTFAYCEGPDKTPMLFKGTCEGSIVEPRGPPNSFGWDPCFQPLNSQLTFAEMEKVEKNKISHRGRALEKVKDYFCKDN